MMMKIGIIGCGIITREAHIPALLEMTDRVRIQAVCNRSRAKAEKTAAMLALPDSQVYTDWTEMIRTEPELDAVLIALPIPLSYPVSRGCAEKGLAVFCEKPAGADGAEARKTLELSAPGKPLFLTAENFHFDPVYQMAAELIRKGKIGRLHSLCWDVLSFMAVDNKYNQTQWRADNRYAGGYVLDGGVHFVHVLQMLAGPVESVYARTGSIQPALGTMDTAFALLTHSNGIISSLNMGWQAASEECGLKAMGTEGSLILRKDSLFFLGPDGEKEPISVPVKDSFLAEWEEFYRAWKTGDKPSMEQEEAVMDVLVIEGIIRSGVSGQPEKVSLREKTDD